MDFIIFLKIKNWLALQEVDFVRTDILDIQQQIYSSVKYWEY